MEAIVHNLFGITAFLLISIAFFFIGYKAKLFTLICAIFILGYVAFSVWNGAIAEFWSEKVLVVAGLVSYFVGLLIVRVIIKRSVSLHMLLDFGEDPEGQIRLEVQSRLDDIIRYRLGYHQGEFIRLTPSGRIVAHIISITYAIMGVKR